ncbi:hypothetical protein [Propioniciclava flava]|uniref:ParA family protein n=1 Tax=Propioniciclava flava TaxID=2072026 RepID=A0A4Q2EL14_9ACTN|nr:hypothetical protein [Propioniciclava flava]RXW32695.1 hypothetical protein C1706_05995 [Propioniciclava flava]
MSSIVLTSASGAPGVTTSALGLTLAWPRASVLVDADRAATPTVMAGYLHGQAAGAGLEAILQAHRERSALPEALKAIVRPLPPLPGDEAPRALLTGFTHLGAIDLFDPVWPPLLDAFEMNVEADIIIDAGRTGHRGLPDPLVREADLVVLVCRTSLIALSGLRPHLAALAAIAKVGATGLVLVGPRRPYAADEVAEQFGVPVLAEIAWDPVAADELHAGPGGLGRRWSRSAFAVSVDRAAEALFGHLARRDQAVAS